MCFASSFALIDLRSRRQELTDVYLLEIESS